MRLIRNTIVVIFACVLFCSAVVAEPAIDACLDYNQTLNAQITNCETALMTEDVTAAQRAYLPPIIATLREGAGDFYKARVELDINDPAAAKLLLEMSDAQFLAERYELGMLLARTAETDFEQFEFVRIHQYELLLRLKNQFSDDIPFFIELLNVGLLPDLSDPHLLVARAESYARLGNWDIAFRDWERAFNLTRYPHMLCFQRAKFFWRDLGLVDEALGDLSLLHEQLQPDSAYLQGLSVVNAPHHEWLANLDLQVLSDVQLQRARVFRFEGEILTFLNDIDAALEVTEELLLLVPNDLFGQVDRANLLAALGQKSEALEAFMSAADHAVIEGEGALELDAGSKYVLLNRGIFYSTQGDVASAMRDYDRIFVKENAQTISGLQRSLAAAGFFHGDTDGVYDAETRRAFILCIQDVSCDVV